MGNRNHPALWLATGILLLARTAIANEPTLVLAGNVDAVVAAGTGVAALREGEVLLLDATGRVVGGCRSVNAAARAARRPDRTERSREEVLEEVGASDEDVSPEAEELLDDEGVEPRARRRSVSARSGAPRALALAGAADAVWVATDDGLWRLDARDGACRPVGLGGHPISRVAARGPVVLALADVTVWRSRDGGATFDVAAVLTSPGHALALGPDDETALVADEDGVVAIGTRGFARRLSGRVDALAVCDDAVFALVGDGVHRLDVDGHDAIVAARPPVRALTCGPGGLVAAGVGLWRGGDGTTWREQAVGIGRSLADVAQAAGRAWLASERGLEVVAPAPQDQVAEDLDVESLTRELAPPATRVPVRRPPVWAALLPRVAITFDGWTRSTGLAGWRVWLRLTVTLGRPGHRATNSNDVEDLR